MVCANVPSSPAAPIALLASLDLILIEWAPPVSDGGSAILGYEVLMKHTGAAPGASAAITTA
jgi:hypothetical protein